MRAPSTAICLAAVAACVTPARPPPKISAAAPQVQRAEAYKKYRLTPITEDQVDRGDETIDIAALGRVVESCPDAKALYPDPPIFPYLLAGAGGGLLGTGLAQLTFGVPDNPATPENEADSNTSYLLLGVGAGLSLVAILVGELAAPEPPKAEEVATTYNACLYRELGLHLRPPKAPPPPAAKVDLPWRTKTSTSSAPVDASTDDDEGLETRTSTIPAEPPPPPRSVFPPREGLDLADVRKRLTPTVRRRSARDDGRAEGVHRRRRPPGDHRARKQ